MKVTLLLADAAQVADGKLYILGGGWSVMGPQPMPFAIAIKVEVPWDQANRKHNWRLALVDADGHPVLVPAGGGGEKRPLEVGGVFEVGRAPGLPAGTPIDLPLALSFAPVPLAPGRRFVWQFEVDGRVEEDWHLAFITRAR